MPIITLLDLNPSDFSTEFPMNSIKQKSEDEQSAFHLMYIRTLNNNKWEITYEEYLKIVKQLRYNSMHKTRFNEFYTLTETIADVIMFSPNWGKKAKEIVAKTNELYNQMLTFYNEFQEIISNQHEAGSYAALEKFQKYQAAVRKCNEYYETRTAKKE